MPWGLAVSVVDPSADPSVDQHTEAGGLAAGPIEHEYDVACSPDRALVAFTGEIAQWWQVGGGCVMRMADAQRLCERLGLVVLDADGDDAVMRRCGDAVMRLR